MKSSEKDKEVSNFSSNNEEDHSDVDKNARIYYYKADFKLVITHILFLKTLKIGTGKKVNKVFDFILSLKVSSDKNEIRKSLRKRNCR
jgi:hypothetical protein